jgi:DNA mismatch repair protein MutL
MPRIHVLSDLLVNKIAAGEVIERPASVVKELVENSIDAGATQIEIAIEQGGRKLIRVVDDGMGMGPDDLELAVQPHATSKITGEDDLFGIRTMGFRGEALPSIGSISQLRICSRTAEADEAYEIRVVGDRVEPVRAAAGPQGTTVEIRELFFNVPARQKFMRTPQTEMGHITEQLARIALAHPEVGFRLTHNGRLVHHLRPADGMRPRIADFYGKDLADRLLEVHRDERGLKISGFVARPEDSRSSSKWQYTFLNGRFIRDRFVAHAIREAYRGLIEHNRSPVVFLAFEIDPAAVDVNVHPTKVEVRWRDSSIVYSQVLSLIRDRFLNTDLTPDLKSDDPQAHKASGISEQSSAADERSQTGASDQAGDAALFSEEATDQERHRRIRESIADFFKQAKPHVPQPGGQRYQSGAAGGFHRSAPPSPPGPVRDVSKTMPTSFQRVESPGRLAQLDELAEQGKVFQVHRSYLVAETDEGLLIIDQHALHERILFEQLSEQMRQGTLESQRLLLPETIDVRPADLEVIEAQSETLSQLGFDMRAGGPATIVLHSVPSLLKPDRVHSFVRDMLDRLASQAGPATADMLTNDLLSMMACKAAVKAGDALEPAEIEALLAKRSTVERSSNCPHGRPTALRLSLHDLEREFKRT